MLKRMFIKSVLNEKVKKIIESKVYCFFMLMGALFFICLVVLGEYSDWQLSMGKNVVCRIITIVFLLLFLLADPVRKFLLAEDWIICIKQTWLKIPALYKKSFLIIFVGLNVVFLFNTVTFVWSNHDWSLLFEKEDFFSWTLSIGRYFYNFLNFFFLDGYFLPVATNLLGFTFFSLSAVLLCYYWRLPKSCFLYSLVGLLFVLQPYSIEVIFGHSYVHLYFFVITGLICGDNVITQNCWLKRVLLFMCSIVFLWFSIGCYAVTVSTITTILLGRIIIDFIFSDKNKVGIKNILYSHILAILALVSACLIHMGVFRYLKNIGVICSVASTSYMVELLKFSDIPHRVLDIVKAIPTYLSNYSVPFFPASFTYLFTILFFIALGVSIIQCFEDRISLKQKIIDSSFIAAMFFIALLTCFLSSFITKANQALCPRIDFFGIMCFHIFTVVIIFSQRIKFIKNIALVICIVLVQISAVQDFYVQKVWKLGFDVEKMEWERIISRIETTPDYNNTKEYRVLMLGATQGYSKYFYKSRISSSTENFMLYSHAQGWGDGPIMPFLTYTCHAKYGVWRQVPQDGAPDEYEKLIKVMSKEIKNADVFPSSKFIAIKDDIMLLVLDKHALFQTQKLLENGVKNE